MSKIKKTRINLRDAGFRTTSTRASKSESMIVPGDLVFFSYQPMLRNARTRPRVSKTPHLCLVVSNKRSRGNAMFWSKAGNKLLSAFDISEASEEVVSTVLKSLYKDRRKCSYSNIIDGLKALFGEKNYKTFSTLNVSELYEIFIVEEDDEG